jgi:hypothetical protein
MATGDITFFEEALDFAFFGGWGASDDIKVALLDNTATPTASFATPALGDFTQVGTSGTYTAGGTSIGGWNALSTESGGTLTFDSSANPTWAAHASNDTDAYWGLIYNDTQSGDPAIAFVTLGGPVNMQAGSLTITWNASGIFTIS